MTGGGMTGGGMTGGGWFGDGLNGWEGCGLGRVGLKQLGADASFGFGDGGGFDGGDEFLKIGIGFGRGPLVGLFAGHPNRMLQSDGEVLFPIFLFLLSLIPFDFVEQLLGEGLAAFFFFGFEELGGGGDEAEGVVIDGFFNGFEPFAISLDGPVAGAGAGLGAGVRAGGAGAGVGLARHGGSGDLEAPEQKAGLLVIDRLAGDGLENFADGEQERGAILGHGQLDAGLAEGAVVGVRN